MAFTIGLDLGGNTINLTGYDGERFLVQEMVEIPARVTEGPDACLGQLEAAFEKALDYLGWTRDQVGAVGLDTPGPATATGVLCHEGPANFGNPSWGGFDIRGALEERLGLPVAYLNDANAAALYAHWSVFGPDADKTSVSLIIGTGLGGGIVAGGRMVVGRVGFAAELGHAKLPCDWHPELSIPALCNCGQKSDLESIASLTGIEKNLLPFFLPRYPDHPLHGLPAKEAAKKVRGLAEEGDPMALEIFRTQTYAIAAHLELMINALDPDAVFIGGGGVEASEAFRARYLDGIQSAIHYREDQRGLPIHIVPDGDRAGARGSALYALQTLRL